MSVNFNTSLAGSCSPLAPASTGANMSYSPEAFKDMLLRNHSFPPSIIVTGDLDLHDCTEVTALPECLNVKGYLYLYHCTVLTALPKGLIVEGLLDLSHCTGLTVL